MVTRILIALVVLSDLAAAQTPQKLTIGIYAPTVEFGTAQARLAYVQGLAKAIEQSTGIKTDAQSYATFAALKKDDVDFAIIEAACFAISPSWKLLANATVAGGTSRMWALYATAGRMQDLRGKKLAYVATGCNDAGFVDNAMLDSEVDSSFFGGRAGEKDLTAAIASVASYKTAQAVFAPVGSAKGLTKLFDTGTVPNPAFVAISGKVPGTVVEKVASAIVGYGGSGAIHGWAKPSREPYQALAGHMAPVKKVGLFATPEPVRLDAKDVLQDPTTLKDPAFVAIRHHFVRPPDARME